MKIDRKVIVLALICIVLGGVLAQRFNILTDLTLDWFSGWSWNCATFAVLWIVTGLNVYLLVANELRISREWRTWAAPQKFALLLLCVVTSPIALLLYVLQVTRERGNRYTNLSEERQVLQNEAQTAEGE